MGNEESILVSVTIPALKLSGKGKQLQTFPYQLGLQNHYIGRIDMSLVPTAAICPFYDD